MKPILLNLAGIELFSYPLFIGIAWGVSYHLSKSYFDKYSINKGLSFQRLFISVFISAWLGAKIFFLLFSVPDQLREYGQSSSFWLGGGFVFYGGFIGGFLYLTFEALITKRFELKDVALFVPAISFSHGIGRIGCFLTGCCYGTKCDLPWSIHMHGDFRHPVQLYEALGLIAIGVSSLYMFKKECSRISIGLFYAFAYSSLRFSLEFFRGDKLRGLHNFGLSTSQYVSLAIMIIAISILIKNYRKLRA